MRDTTLEGAAGTTPVALSGRPGRLLAGLVAVLLVTLTACSTAPSTASSSTPSTSSSPVASATATSAAPRTTSAAELVDPRTLTGPGSVTLTTPIAPVATSPQQTLPVTHTDHTGKTITITNASRVLLLDIYGTFSQIAVALGLGDVLVGRTASDTAPELANKPLVTRDGHDLNAEAILSLTPTLVVTDTTLGPPEVLEQLRNSGVTVVTLSPERTMATVASTITTVATVLGVPAEGRTLAERAVADVEKAKADVAAIAPADPMRMAVLYIRGTAGVFFIFGQGYGTGALLEAIHADDVATRMGIKDVRPANAESLVTLDPEVIIVMTNGLESTGGVDGLLQRPGVAQTTAGINKRVISVPDSMLLSFGPNTGQVIRALATTTYTK